MKQSLPLTGGYWLEAENGFLLGHYDGPDGKALGVFRLTECEDSVPVPVADGEYENRLGGRVTVCGGRMTAGQCPAVI